MLTYLSTPEGGRVINRRYKPTEVGLVRQRFPLTRGTEEEELFRSCPGGFYYELVTGTRISERVTRMAQEAAIITTIGTSKNDLHVIPFGPSSPNHHPLLLAHSIEHLVTWDLENRRILPLLEDGTTLARTLAFCETSSSHSRLVIGFYVREDVVPPDETHRSLVSIRAMSQTLFEGRIILPRVGRYLAAQSILISSTSKIKVDPAGMSPTDLSP